MDKKNYELQRFVYTLEYTYKKFCFTRKSKISLISWHKLTEEESERELLKHLRNLRDSKVYDVKKLICETHYIYK